MGAVGATTRATADAATRSMDSAIRFLRRPLLGYGRREQPLAFHGDGEPACSLMTITGFDLHCPDASLADRPGVKPELPSAPGRGN